MITAMIAIQLLTVSKLIQSITPPDCSSETGSRSRGSPSRLGVRDQHPRYSTSCVGWHDVGLRNGGGGRPSVNLPDAGFHAAFARALSGAKRRATFGHSYLHGDKEMTGLNAPLWRDSIITCFGTPRPSRSVVSVGPHGSVFRLRACAALLFFTMIPWVDTTRFHRASALVHNLCVNVEAGLMRLIKD